LPRQSPLTPRQLEAVLAVVHKAQAAHAAAQQALEADLLEFARCVAVLGAMETPVTGPLADFCNTLRAHCKHLRERNEYEQDDYLAVLGDYVAWCGAVKDVLRLRDQKQIDYEELTAYLQKTQLERDETMRSGHGSGLVQFMKGKVDELRGADLRKKRDDRVRKLDKRIEELTTAVKDSNETSAAFSTEVERELELFHKIKDADMRGILADYVDTQVVFWTESAKLWHTLVPVIKSISITDNVVVANTERTIPSPTTHEAAPVQQAVDP
jgi:sorting nexin-4